MEDHFPNFEEFVFRQITSLDHLRILLLCHNSPDTDWNAIEVSHKLTLPPETATMILADLAAKHLLVFAGDSGRYHYQPQSSELAHLTERLAGMDRVQPVTLVSLVSRGCANSRPAPLLSNSQIEEQIG